VKPLRLFTVRHGETAFARERRFAGARDVPLTPLGQRQCEAVARALSSAFVEAVYTSPLGRAQASAAPIAAPHKLTARVEPAFREMAFGEWEGLTLTEATLRFPREMEAWAATPHLVQPPGGERLAAVAARVAAGLATLTDAHAGQTVVLVSHAIVIRLVVLAALGLGPDRLWSVDASPAGISEIEYVDGWTTVHRMNTLIHLDSREGDPLEGSPVPFRLGRAP
jgi:ribonuclease H / adenosylcobalamin/alpha-ribazole phosphatase